MILAVASAWALTCTEIANMTRAGVPEAQVATEINRAGTPIDLDMLGCLLAQRAPDDVVRAAARLNAIQSVRPQVLDKASSPGTIERLRVELECGSVQFLPSDDDAVHLQGTTEQRTHLGWVVSNRGLRIVIADDAAQQRALEAELPRFPTPFAPAPASEPTARARKVRLPCADLTIAVPPAMPIAVDTTRADIRFHGLAGDLDLTDHFGDVEIVGSNSDIRVRTTGGDVFTDTGARSIEVETVSGRLVLGAGLDARVTTNSISGDVWVWGGPVDRLNAKAVSGDVNFFGTFVDRGSGTLLSHAGDVVARVPGGRVAVSSHEGQALGLERSQRSPGKLAFPDADLLGPAWYGIWGETPTRWWFGSGAVLSTAQAASSVDFDLSASAFSGTVDVSSSPAFPAPTGPVIARLQGVQDRLHACSTAQFARSGGTGHAVATLHIRSDGELDKLAAPATSLIPGGVDDGKLSACVTAALQGLAFDPGSSIHVRWPVLFGPELEIPDARATRVRIGGLSLPAADGTRRPD